MLTSRIIPCLDCKDGRVVKGVMFQNLVDSGAPEVLACMYEEEGADEIVLLDITATVDARATHLELVRRVRSQLSIPLTVGGGIASLADVEALLHAGADKVSVNSAAVFRPHLIDEIATQFGSQCMVLAIDARKLAAAQNDWEVLVHSGKASVQLSALSWAKEGFNRGAGEILLTSWNRDGTGLGYDTELIRAIREIVEIPIIASGGAATPSHCIAALGAGADAILAASIFHNRVITISQLKEALQTAGFNIRL